jgi:hypothetical protein
MPREDLSVSNVLQVILRHSHTGTVQPGRWSRLTTSGGDQGQGTLLLHPASSPHPLVSRPPSVESRLCSFGSGGEGADSLFVSL